MDFRFALIRINHSGHAQPPFGRAGYGHLLIQIGADPADKVERFHFYLFARRRRGYRHQGQRFQLVRNRHSLPPLGLAPMS
jgi:hypothetical protein